MSTELRVLLVEDEFLVRQTIKMILQPHAEEITLVGEATNGREALEIMEKHAVDVMITDVVMPQMNGLDLLTEVRARWPQTHVIILSGFSDFDYVKTAFKKGIVDYILKPQLTPELLMEYLRSIHEEINGIFAKKEDPCEQLYEYIKEHYMEPLTLLDAANRLHISYSSISARFSAWAGKGFKEVLNEVRMDKAQELLLNENLSILEIALSVGYSDQSYFCKVFKARTGESPMTWRKRESR